MLKKLQLKKKYQNNLAFRYLSIATLFLLGIQVVTSGLQASSTYQKSLRRLDSRIDKYANFFARSIRSPFLERDLETLNALATSATDDQDIVYSIFLDNNQQVLAFGLEQNRRIQRFLARGNLNADYSKDLLKKLNQDRRFREIVKPVIYSDRKIGEIRLGYSLLSVEETLIGSLFTSLGYALLVSLLFTTLTLLIFERQILTPLKMIHLVATEFAEGNLETRIKLHRENEIGELGNVLNSMAAQLEYSLSNLKEVMNEAIIAEKAKSQFLGRMSHELKTPLNGIIGFTQIMQQDAEATTEQLENLDIIQESSLRLLKLIEDVLEITRIESGQFNLQYATFDLVNLLQSLEVMFRFKAQEKKLDLFFKIDRSVPQMIKGDEEKLRKIIVSLLDNAFKFTTQGNVSVTVKKKIAPEYESLANLYFKIHDTGKGIAPDKIDALFVTFSQTENVAKTIDGMGLGLPSSKKLIELMGGELRIQSVEGEGTTVRFSIPFDQTVATEIELDSQNFFNPDNQELEDSIDSQFFNDPNTSYELTAQKLASMSREWLVELQNTTIAIDNEAIFLLLAQISEQDQDLQQALADLIENFRYDSILELTDEALAQKDTF